MREIVIDIETTGLSKTENEILEVAAIVYENGEEVEVFHQLVKPRGSIPYIITKLTGITDKMVAHSKAEGVVLTELSNFINKANCQRVMGFNSKSFDIPFILTRGECLGVNFNFPADHYDVLVQAKNLYKVNPLPGYNYVTERGRVSHKLTNYADYFKLGTQTHRADDDVRQTYIVHQKLNEHSTTTNYGF